MDDTEKRALVREIEQLVEDSSGMNIGTLKLFLEGRGSRYALVEVMGAIAIANVHCTLESDGLEVRPFGTGSPGNILHAFCQEIL